MKAFVVAGIGVGLLVTGAQAGQQFYATNNLSATNFGTAGDELITYDFNTALWNSVGTIGGGITGGFGGLDWAGTPGNGPLIGTVSFGGASTGEFYSISPNDASAQFIGNAPANMADLAWNPANNKMYGVGGASGNDLYVDNNADNIPETNLGTFNIQGGLDVGLGFDAAGNVYVHDIATDAIYKGVGDNPASVVVLYALAYNSNFSQGLYVGGGLGYHGALDAGNLTSPNYLFALDGSSYTLQSTFATHAPNGLPEVEVGDLTPVSSMPAPGVLALLGVAGVIGSRRRRS